MRKYNVETELQSTQITFVFIPPEHVEREAVHDACNVLFNSSLNDLKVEGVGSLEGTSGPGYDSAVGIDIRYETVEEFLENYKKDEKIYRRIFERELRFAMDRYFERKLLLYLHADLEEHVFTTESDEIAVALGEVEDRLEAVTPENPLFCYW